MLTFTLDTNCLIALDENRPEAAAVRGIVDAHASGKAQVAIVAISASEKQKGGGHLESFVEFQKRLALLSLDHLELLPPMFYWDITYWDRCIWPEAEMESTEKRIHEILFPNVQFLWSDYCAAQGITDANPPLAHKWRNAKCDVQAIWSHIYHKRNVFVTGDHNFRAETKKPSLIALGANKIETPDSALLLLNAA